MGKKVGKIVNGPGKEPCSKYSNIKLAEDNGKITGSNGSKHV